MNWLIAPKHWNGYVWTNSCQKMALNGQNYHNFYIDPVVLCLSFIQVIGMCLLIKSKELRDNLLPKTLKMTIFQWKMAKKLPLMT